MEVRGVLQVDAPPTYQESVNYVLAALRQLQSFHWVEYARCDICGQEFTAVPVQQLADHLRSHMS